MGGISPKQFTPIKDFPLYLYSLHPFLTFINKAVIVVPNSRVQEVKEDLRKTYADPVLPDFFVVEGGESRQESVRIGLKSLPSSIDKVLIHDAARPLITAELIERVIQGTKEQGACIPVLNITDTVKEVDGPYIVRTLERETLALAQTPQGFDVQLLRESYDMAARLGFQGTDESSLVEKMGAAVLTVKGDFNNIKVTWREDLKKVERLLPSLNRIR